MLSCACCPLLIHKLLSLRCSAQRSDEGSLIHCTASSLPAASNDIKRAWGVQVALLQGLNEEAKAELQKGVREGGQHLNKLLKFLTVRNDLNGVRSGITLAGGSHDADLDGSVTSL